MLDRPLFTIAPHAHFLDTLADRLLDGTLLGGWPRTGPFWLADVTVFLPTRRARLGLADALSRRGAGLLPDIRTFGGEAAEEEPFLPPFDTEPLPPPVTRLERRGTLASQIAKWADQPAGAEVFASPPNLAETLALADSLGTLIDDLLIEGIDPARLRSLVNEENLAANWQQTLQFLEIALGAWPLILAEHGKAEGADLRNRRLARQAANALAIYGDRPVIAAGSTGSIPATAGLLKAIAALPRGAVVLPGLDTGLTTDQHQRLLSEREAPHGHPQYGLAKLLRHLGQTPANVVELAGAASIRTLAVRRAFALAGETASWVSDRAALADELPAATDGMAILAARTEDEQARAIALAARQALVDGQSVGIICPDQNLSRRIAAELGRFDIAVDDPAGDW
jgi:ATP-dependent helicase/nuclease subunit B